MEAVQATKIACDNHNLTFWYLNWQQVYLYYLREKADQNQISVETIVTIRS